MTGSWPARLGVRPAAVVLDCDGLLVDTEPSWSRAEAELFTRRGLPYGEAERALFLGVSVRDSAAIMADRFAEPGRVDALYDELLAAVHGRLEAEAVALPGAVDLVAGLRARGVPVAVASNSPRPVVAFSLDRAGLSGQFDAVVTADDVTRPKPAPDPYLAACRRLGADPAGSVAFEDSATGLAAARAAGLATVGVPDGSDELVADWVVPRLDDPAIRSWLAAW